MDPDGDVGVYVVGGEAEAGTTRRAEVRRSGFDESSSSHHHPLESLNSSFPTSWYTCYASSSSKAFPLNRMWTYLTTSVNAKGPPADGQLYTAQALWEETPNSIVVSQAHGSSLLGDETRSKLNALVTQKVKDGFFKAKNINMIEVNNVCDGGQDLLAALR